MLNTMETLPEYDTVQNLAAKYISKMLKPIIQLVPSIIHGIKDLAIKLSKIQLIPNRKFYLITGDVVAYCPSIPIEKYIDITCEFYMEFYHNVITPTNDTDLRKAELFIKYLQIGNRELILQYNDKMYL